VGDPTDPQRFTDEDLLERELEYGKSGFALQFMLDTTLSDANKYPLKISDLIVSSCPALTAPGSVHWSNSPLHRIMALPNVAMAGQYYFAPENITAAHVPYSKSVLVIDPSGRGKDETGYAVGKNTNGNIFCPDAGGMEGGYSDGTMIALCETAKKWKVNVILIESNFGDGMFASLLLPHLNRIYPCTIEEVRHNQQKEMRIIESLEPVMNQHRLIIDPSVIQRDYDTALERYTPDKAPQYMLMYQLARISKQRGALKHDDRLDALAMMVQYFSPDLKFDQKQAEQRKQEEAMQAYCEQFTREMNGGSSNHQLNFHTRMANKLHSNK